MMDRKDDVADDDNDDNDVDDDEDYDDDDDVDKFHCTVTVLIFSG